MSPKKFKHWRKSLGLSQKGAARALGLKTRIVQYYEKGERDGKKVEVPLSVRLACWALGQGIADFDGEEAVAVVELNDGEEDALLRRRQARGPDSGMRPGSD